MRGVLLGKFLVDGIEIPGLQLAGIFIYMYIWTVWSSQGSSSLAGIYFQTVRRWRLYIVDKLRL